MENAKTCDLSQPRWPETTPKLSSQQSLPKPNQPSGEGRQSQCAAIRPPLDPRSYLSTKYVRSVISKLARHQPARRQFQNTAIDRIPRARRGMRS